MLDDRKRGERFFNALLFVIAGIWGGSWGWEHLSTWNGRALFLSAIPIFVIGIIGIVSVFKEGDDGK